MATSNKRKGTASPSGSSAHPRGKKRMGNASAPSATVETSFEEGSKREDWLIERLKESVIYTPLQQAGRKSHGTKTLPSKAFIYRQLAKEFNEKKFPMPTGRGFFTTSENGFGIKNKIARMQMAFKAAHSLRQSSRFENSDDQSWREAVLKECRFYFDLADVWGQNWNEGIAPHADSRAGLTDTSIPSSLPQNKPEGDEEDPASISSQEDDDYPLIDRRRPDAHKTLWERLNRSPSASSETSVRSLSAAPVVTTSQSSATSRTTNDRQERSSREPDRLMPNARASENAHQADLGKQLKDLAETARVTAELEYQKALVNERVRLKEIEMRMKENELRVREKEIKLREKELDHLLEMAKVQANKEVQLDRQQREMAMLRDPAALRAFDAHHPPSSHKQRQSAESPKSS
ncbi:hypothetical protein BGW41_000284, partial [Actinomortierella wolfii]